MEFLCFLLSHSRNCPNQSQERVPERLQSLIVVNRKWELFFVTRGQRAPALTSTVWDFVCLFITGLHSDVMTYLHEIRDEVL